MTNLTTKQKKAKERMNYPDFIYFKIPFTCYYIGQLTLFHPKEVQPKQLCLYVRVWAKEVNNWCWRALI